MKRGKKDQQLKKSIIIFFLFVLLAAAMILKDYMEDREELTKGILRGNQGDASRTEAYTAETEDGFQSEIQVEVMPRESSAEESRKLLEQAKEQYILIRPVDPPYTMREISIATKGCFSAAFRQNLPVFFECGVIVPLERIRGGRCTEASHAFLPIEQTDPDENILCLPSGTYACVYHVGDYLSIGRSYRRVLEYCDNHNLEILSDSYEFCINDYITSRDENEYITKIMLRVSDGASQQNGNR